MKGNREGERLTLQGIPGNIFLFPLTLAACFQLVRFVLRIGFAQGGVGGGGCHPQDDSTWQLSWLAVESHH